MQLQAISTEIIESAGIGSGGTDPDITVLTNGQILISWTEYLDQPSDKFSDTDGAVFARLLDSEGVPAGDIFQVNISDSFAQGESQVYALSSGAFAIGYTSYAVYGDDTADTDSFITFYDADGQPFEFVYDVYEDSPSETSDDVLQEIVSLDAGRAVVITRDPNSQDGVNATVLDESGKAQAYLNYTIDDMVQLANGNIVMASLYTNSDNQEVIAVAYTGSDFGAPDGLAGIYEPFFSYFAVDSTRKADNNIEVAALGGGGFALAYVEQDEDASRIQLRFVTDELIVANAADPIAQDFTFDSEKGEFDMIGLSGGGVALAVTQLDSDSGTTVVSVMLYDTDGTLLTRLQVGDPDAGDQANPSLTEAEDGTVMLAYTDTSSGDAAAEGNPVRLAFFEVTGKQGKFVGSDGDDVLRGLAGDETLAGGTGDDDISGQKGNDILRGGAGDDILDGGKGKDALRGGDGADMLRGGNGNDGLGGGAGADDLRGEGGNDILGGGAGDDQLRGNGGDDYLKGGNGDDVLIGGGGSDTFYFVRGRSGDDTIADFEAAEDVLLIDLRGATPSSVEVAQSGDDTVVSFGSASVTLEDVSLDADDITFAYV